jgi:glutamine synthetase
MDSPRWFRLTFVDVFGASKALQLPASGWQVAQQRGVMFDGSSMEGPARHFEAEMVLRPVPETLVDLGDGIGRVVCEVDTPTGTPWPGDPRTALRLIIEREPELHGPWQGVWELEYYLLDRDGVPLDRGTYFDAVAGLGAEISRTAADVLSDHNVPVLSSHHEAGPGQYEIDAGPLPAVELADSLVLAKQVIQTVANSRGASAVFLPRPLEGEAGSGMHVHQRADGLLTTAKGGLTDLGRSYVGANWPTGGACARCSPRRSTPTSAST